MMDDPFDLDRFLAAQSGGVYEQALAELAAGAKRSHWIWFIFPQHRDLGRSPTAKYFGLSGVEEAAAYAAHPVLGRRLRESIAAIARHLEAGRTAEQVLGEIDALKLRSSLAIFRAAAPNDPAFRLAP
jgi:uncharacterized protein (DUF1810 family)